MIVGSSPPDSVGPALFHACSRSVGALQAGVATVPQKMVSKECKAKRTQRVRPSRTDRALRPHIVQLYAWSSYYVVR